MFPYAKATEKADNPFLCSLIDTLFEQTDTFVPRSNRAQIAPHGHHSISYTKAMEGSTGIGAFHLPKISKTIVNTSTMKKTFSLPISLLLFFCFYVLQAQELHTESNATSITNESNSLDGWTYGNAIGTVETTDAFHGNYAIKFEAQSDGWQRGTYRFNTTQGQQYLITLAAKSSSPTNPEINISGTVEPSYTRIVSSNWSSYSLTVTASGTSIDVRVYLGLPALQGNTAYIDSFSITPVSGADTQAPTAPSLSSTGQTDTTVNLAWSGATDNVGVIGYKIFMNGSYFSNTANVGTHQMQGLTPGTNYNFVVKALDAAGNESVDSNQISVTTNSGPDTQAPTAPSLSSTAHTDTTVDLSWSGATDNIGVTGYRIFKDGALETTLGNVGTHQVTGLATSTAYSFTVTALDASGNESVASNAVLVTTDAGSGGGSGSSVWSETGSTASYTGNVAVGRTTVPSGYKLAVDGHVRAREVRVDQDTWPDYVFKEDYDLPTLDEIQEHIQKYGHLPNIPSAEEVRTNGVELGEMNRLLLEKIEELTLHIIQLKKEIRTNNQKP